MGFGVGLLVGIMLVLILLFAMKIRLIQVDDTALNTLLSALNADAGIPAPAPAPRADDTPRREAEPERLMPTAEQPDRDQMCEGESTAALGDAYNTTVAPDS